jgi:RHS repeat-associated protein
MRTTDLGGGGTAYYVNDAAGQRVRKVIERIGTLVEERIYLGGYEVYRKRDHTGVLLERETLHVLDGVRRIALVETKTVDTAAGPFTVTPRIRYQLGNHLGSAVLELDETGLVISYEEYHPYGTTAYGSGRAGVEVSARRYRYTGKEKDEETGLYYHGARYYACWLGRWTSSDPAGMVDGPNLFQYSRDNPVVLLDPNGMQTFSSFANPTEKRAAEAFVRGESDAAVSFETDRLEGHAPVRQGTTTVERIRPDKATEDAAEVRAAAGGASARRDFSDATPVLPFFIRDYHGGYGWHQYVRAYQTPPSDAPVGLAALRQLNAGGSLAVAQFSREHAPGTSLESLTVEAVGVISAGASPLVPLGRAASVADDAVRAGANAADDAVRAGANAAEEVASVADDAARAGSAAFKGPAGRHTLRSVKQSTVAKEINTVIEPGVDVAADVAGVNQGLAKRVGNTFEINGRIYGIHDGTLFPISGPGFHQLNRGAFQALGVLNKFGDSPQAHSILARMKNVGPSEIEAALKAWRAGQ